MDNAEEEAQLGPSSSILVGKGRAETHPLFSSSILSSIFGYLDIESIKATRLTCSFWKEEASPILQKNSKISIAWSNESDKPNQPTLPTFMNYVKSVSTENVFFRNYELLNWTLHSKEVQMTEFWLSCGKHIRTLLLQKHRFRFLETSYVRDVFYKWTPNMEEFRLIAVSFNESPDYEPLKKAQRVSVGESFPEIDMSDFEDRVKVMGIPMSKFAIDVDVQKNWNLHTLSIAPCWAEEFPIPWKEIFKAYPNLTNLRVVPFYFDEGAVDIIKELLVDLKEFREENPQKLQKLKQLDIFTDLDSNDECIISNEHFELAAKLNFPLESIWISFNSVRELSYSVVGNYLRKLSPSLKVLELVSAEEAFPIFPPTGKTVCFPELTGLNVQLTALSTNTIQFLENTPNLKKLFIGEACTFERTEPRLVFNTITLKPQPCLIAMLIKKNILTSDCIRKLGEWFPNLTTFEAVLNDRMLWAVYKYLHKVESFYVRGYGMTDAGITGHLPSEHNEPGPSTSKSDERPLKASKYCGGENPNTQLSIVEMKNLRLLAIKANCVHARSRRTLKLGDASVFHGLTKSKKLKHLFLPRTEITEHGYRELFNHLDTLTLETETPYFKRFMNSER